MYRERDAVEKGRCCAAHWPLLLITLHLVRDEPVLSPNMSSAPAVGSDVSFMLRGPRENKVG